VNLSVQERLLLLEALAAVRGNFAELRILRELKENLSFSEEEHKELGLRAEGGKMFWNPAAAQDKEIEIGDVAREIIVQRFKELNEQKVLTEAHLFIVDRFPEIEGDE